MPKAQADAFCDHLEQEHLTPDAIGKMASAAHVKTVVLTHFTPDSDNETGASKFTRGIRKYYRGPVIAWARPTRVLRDLLRDSSLQVTRPGP